MLSGMLFPFVYAQNDEDEEDKMTARVMRILIEEHLRTAKYEMKFLYLVLSALVNPAVFINVEYVVAYQRVKQKLRNGEVRIIEAVDELLTGLNLNIYPLDQVLLADFYTSDIQRQPYVITLRRISWDEARKIYGSQEDFKYVSAGKTRVFLAGNDQQTLFDIEYTQADGDYVQEITAYYRDEDLQVCFVGGVFMGNKENVYNTNPFSHRRMSLIGDEWITIPVIPIAKAYFEPIDPNGRFVYGKSAAFKEYWDDATQNKMHQLLVDGTYLDVIKPTFISGISKADGIVIAPGATTPMPTDARVNPYNLGPNLAAAINAMNIQKDDMSDSTQDRIMQGAVEKGVTAYATSKAEQNARIFLGVFGRMTGELVRDIGELTKDCLIQHTTVGEVDATVPEALRMKYRTILARTKEKGKEMTNRIEFTDKFFGKTFTKEEKNKYEWDLYEKSGGDKSDQEIYQVNPYKFARSKYAFYVDADAITMRASGVDSQRKVMRFQMLTNQAVYPYVDAQEFANEIIEEFSDGDPERLKKKGDPMQDMMSAIMGTGGQTPQAQPSVGALPQLQGQQPQMV